jgi:signal transduction histidine kinase
LANYDVQTVFVPDCTGAGDEYFKTFRSQECDGICRDKREKKIKVVVQDDGAGINLKQIQYGKGFSNIQEKTEALGGNFNLESVEGRPGFKLEVVI